MSGISGRRRGKPWMSPGDGGDYITGLPLELRAHIASFLPFRQVGQLSSLSWPWRSIHDHTTVVHLNLQDFLITGNMLNEDAIAALKDAFRRRGQEDYSGSSKVDILRITYSPDYPRMTLHTQRIIELTDAREICINFPDSGRTAWTLDTPPSARNLEVVGFHRVATIAGPGAAYLQTLLLHHVVLCKWPRLQLLRSLTLRRVIIEARFRPGTWCPQLEYLGISNSIVEQHRVDICLPHLKTLDIHQVHVNSYGYDRFREPLCLGDVTIECPELEKLDMCCTAGTTPDYGRFTLRAPRLRHLIWRNQFAERVDVQLGRPSSVTSGLIEFSLNSGNCREMEEYNEMMLQMLRGVLPELPPDNGVADATRPYMTHDKYPVPVKSFQVSDLFNTKEKLICNLSALMSSLQV